MYRGIGRVPQACEGGPLVGGGIGDVYRAGSLAFARCEEGLGIERVLSGWDLS